PLLVSPRMPDERPGTAVHAPTADRMPDEQAREHAAYRALFRPHLDTLRLLVPEVAPAGLRDAARILLGVRPGRRSLNLACFVGDPVPWDGAVLAGLAQQSVYALHVGPRHQRDQAGREEFVADTAAGDRLRGLSGTAHRLDQIERALGPTATLFPTGLRMLAGAGHAPPRRSIRSRSPNSARAERRSPRSQTWSPRRT